jgi:micrococcal nuclease
VRAIPTSSWLPHGSALGPAVLLAASLGACAASHAAPASSSVGARAPETASILRVVDGDTIHVDAGGVDERVRLIGVDTPEVSTFGGHKECFGPQASMYTTSRLSGRRVRLVFDVELRDRYGRLLAYVYLGPELFNLTLVREGFATADPVPPDTRMAPAFERAAREARAAGRGLWSACAAPG